MIKRLGDEVMFRRQWIDVNEENLIFKQIFNIDLDLQYESQTGKYYPILYLNNYWNLLVDYQPINTTVE